MLHIAKHSARTQMIAVHLLMSPIIIPSFRFISRLFVPLLYKRFKIQEGYTYFYYFFKLSAIFTSSLSSIVELSKNEVPLLSQTNIFVVSSETDLNR